MEINKAIDYIQDPNDTYEAYLEKAKVHNVRCVFANFHQVKQGIEILEDTDVILASAVDFPLGRNCIEANFADIENYYQMGIKEIDYVLNQFAIENRDFDYIEKQMTSTAKYCRKRNITDKAIVEMCKLDYESKIIVCEIALRAKPKFLKTSTGKSLSGAKLQDVQLMKRILKDEVKIKAAGGIKDYLFAKELFEAGASALGASAGIKIIQEANNDMSV